MNRLWFGDERGYNATIIRKSHRSRWLWFGDERGYNATIKLVMLSTTGCGLVMKEDITQRTRPSEETTAGCGLVMKEDITQQSQALNHRKAVVVW